MRHALIRNALGLLRSGLVLAVTVTALCVSSTGCDDMTGTSAAPAAAPSRFEAVAAKAGAADPLKDFCDVRAEPGQGKAFHFPAVQSGAPTDPGQNSFLWLNLWATWCKPCVDEMPRIAAWQKQLAAQGKSVDVRFVSVDEDAQAVTAFRAAHPGMPESLMIADAATLAPYIAEIGLDSGAGLPVHVFVDKGAQLRCVRSGAVLDSHYATVVSMLP
jgi:thiol-disulfide isomerase/thioredoxin